jgi:phenylalanyl-tRNA synthetase beta chain
MLVSLHFIEKFISLPKIDEEIIVNGKKIKIQKYDLAKICPILTRQGFEVDSVKILGESFYSVVVGKIESAKPHPNANKLQVCMVNVGEENLRQIVCGAPNARANLFVAVALPGTKLPNGVEIKPTIIRDIESHGMLCSREELGLPLNKTLDGEGIWELDVDAQGGKTKQELEKGIGIPLHEVLSLNDVVVEISVTPNRPDILCHEGVARELAAGFNYAKIPFEKRNPYFSNESSVATFVSEEKIKADAVQNSSLKCKDFVFTAENFLNAPTFFMAVDGIHVSHSPAWLRNLLEALGQTSINNIVDASNYILLAYGQPNHAFDFEKIQSIGGNQKKIVLRHATANENFVGLDGKTRMLHESDCVVSDSKEVIALLGVLGGENSKVSEKTEKIIVEFANPNPVFIRRTSRRHGRQTDASFMFEKGINAAHRFKACSEFFALLAVLSQGKINYLGAVHSKNLESFPILKTEFTNQLIQFTKKDQKRVLGADIVNFENQKEILLSLGFELKKQDDETEIVTVPHWRSHDIVNSADLVEECIRVVGIDSIPAQPIIGPSEVKKDDQHLSFIEKLNSQTASLGYNEIISLHFMRADDFEKCNLNSINSLGEPIALLNPIIGDEPFMHTTLIPDLLRKVSKNLNYGVKNGQLFHSCRTFQNSSAQGGRVFLDNGIGFKLNEQLSKSIDFYLAEYSFQYGFSYSKEKITRPVETPRLAGVIFGVKEEKMWQNSTPTKWSLHDIMSHVQEIGRVTGVALAFEKMTENHSLGHPVAKALHPGRRVEFFIILENKEKLPIGWCGEFHPKVLRNYEIDGACFGFEINVASLMKASHLQNKFVKKNITTQKFPMVTRDFAFLLDSQVSAKDIQNIVCYSLSDLIKMEIPVNLREAHIFDIYNGKGIPSGKKSVAFKVSLEPLTRTLTEKDIQTVTDKVVVAMEKELKAQLRG